MAVVTSEVVSGGLTLHSQRLLSYVVVDHVITGAHLAAVFWQDVYHSGRNPDLAEGIVHCNGLAGIQGCKRFAPIVCL